MAEIGAEYQEAVGREQGGGRFYMKEDGEFKFWDTDYTGKYLRNLFGSKSVITVIANSAGALSVTDLPSMGRIYFSIANAASNASARLAVPSVGQQIWMYVDGITAGASVKVTASTGVTLIDLNNASVSIISLSAGNPGMIGLMCFTAGVWSIVENSSENIDMS